MIITANEKKVLRLLSVSNEFSINDVAKECKITPNGAYKILKKLENEGILLAKPVSNIKMYKLDFISKKTSLLLQLAFMPDVITERVKLRAEDLSLLGKVTSTCIIFGSYITEKQKPSDLDALFLLEKVNYAAFKQTLSKVRGISPLKIQDIVQTKEDMVKNILNNDPIVLDAIRKGIVLWGFDKLAEEIEDVAR